jgi:hypothetical protein
MKSLLAATMTALVALTACGGPMEEDFPAEEVSSTGDALTSVANYTFKDSGQMVMGGDPLHPFVNPCTGRSATATLSYSGTMHITEFSDGSFRFSASVGGELSGTDGAVSFSGKFQSGGAAGFNSNMTFQNSLQIQGKAATSDGRSFNFHFKVIESVTSDGTYRVDVRDLTAKCL